MSTNKGNISKTERTNLRREESKRRKLLKQLVWFGGIALVIISVGVLISFQQKTLPGEKIAVMDDQSHIPDVTSAHTPYNSDPPTSGPHVEHIAKWGVYKTPLPKELLVHNLEDGGVVIYYSDQANTEMIDKLESIAKSYPENVVVSPYPNMKNPIILTAWGRMDKMSEMDEERITTFINAYIGIDHHK